MNNIKSYFETGLGKLYHGELPSALKDISDNSFDSIVTDPPYGISFMGKKWDYDVPSVEIWEECLRVLKPGGYLLSFAGTRTQHRMAVNIEDAGFEIRDMIGWIYGSGFPKSHNISKAIDKMLKLERRNIGYYEIPLDSTSGRAGKKYTHDVGCAFESKKYKTTPISEANSKEAKQWEGWGSNLKPALEPITVARKPLSEKTVAENVLKWGTGGINIDGCRVEGEPHHNYGSTCSGGIYTGKSDKPINTPPQGRFPANLIHDGSDEVAALFPESKGQQGDLKNHSKDRQSPNGCFGKMSPAHDHLKRDDKGSAARFFYCAKSSKSDRGEGNTWPTVKPSSLMQYLVKLVTPIGGTVLDPFGGSGSTAKACEILGVKWVLFDKELEAVEITVKRLKQETAQLKLFK